MTEQERQPEERAAAPTEAPDGCLSSRLVRTVLIAVVVVVVLAAIAVVVVLALRDSRDKPLDVAIYPGARLVNHETLYDGFDHLQYYSDDPFADVEAFYLERKGMTCEPQYRMVEERPGQDAAYVIESERARKELGWAPQIGIEEGLSEVVQWVEDYWREITMQSLEYQHRA